MDLFSSEQRVSSAPVVINAHRNELVCLATNQGGSMVSCDWWRAVLTSDWWRAVLTSDWWRAVLTSDWWRAVLTSDWSPVCSVRVPAEQRPAVRGQRLQQDHHLRRDHRGHEQGGVPRQRGGAHDGHGYQVNRYKFASSSAFIKLYLQSIQQARGSLHQQQPDNHPGLSDK